MAATKDRMKDDQSSAAGPSMASTPGTTPAASAASARNPISSFPSTIG
jgi:hypothetical protein